MNETRNSVTLDPLQNGFTLVELIIVIVVLGIIAAYAFLNSGATPAELTVPSHARRLASDIRYAQTLAFTSGVPMQFAITTAGANGSYSATCVTVGTVPPATTCNPVNNFNGKLENGVELTGGPLTPLVFDTLGKPNQNASYTVGSNHTVSVAPLTGLVTVTP